MYFGNLYFVDIVDIALCVCRLLLYNNFKKGVMSRVNVYFAFRMLLCFRVLVALLSNVESSIMLSSDNRNNMDYWIFNARYCFEYVSLCFWCD